MKKLIKEFINHEKTKGQKAKSTIENYQRYLTKFSDYTGDIKPMKVNLDLIDGFQKSLIKNKAGISTQHYYLIAIRVFLKWLRLRKDLDCLDPEKIELPKIHRKIQDSLTEKESKALLQSAIPQGKQGIRDRAVLELLIGSGIRVGEIVKLKVNDLDFENKRFIVNGKGDKDRTCYLTDGACHFLKKHLETRKYQSPYVFNTRGNGEALNSRSVQRLVKKQAQVAGIKKTTTPHTLRRTFGCSMLRRGVDLRYIKEFLGHENIGTTTLYTKVENPELAQKFKIANKRIVKNVDGGARQEFVVMSQDNFYKLTGMISQNRQLLLEINRKLNESK